MRCLAFILLSISLPAVAQTLTWEKQYNGPNSLYDTGIKVKSDASGNVYVTATSEEDIVLIKYNAVGVQQWVARYDSVFINDQGNTLHTQDRATDLLMDAAGNSYVTGIAYFEGNCKKVSAVTLKYNASGIRQWKVGNTATASCAQAYDMQNPRLGMDGSGNLYLAVSYQASGNSTSEAVLQKLTPQGSQAWRKTIQSAVITGALQFSDFDVDAVGNAVAGIYSSSGNLLLKYNSAGNLQWQKQVGLVSSKATLWATYT